VKKLLIVLSGTMVAAALMFVNPGQAISDSRDADEKVYRDDDLAKLKLDEDRSTLYQIPKEEDLEGAAAGGIRDDDDMESEKSDDMESMEKEPSVPDKYRDMKLDY
jgi:hypothetical protein